MGARDFEAGSAQWIELATHAYAGLGTAHSHAMLCTVESLPGGAAFSVGTGMSSGAVSPVAVIAINGPAGDTIAYAVNGTAVADPAVDIVPALGVPYLFVCAKDAGTVAPRFLAHNYATCTTTYDAGSGTIANRTAGVAAGVVGAADLGTSFWDGWIAATAQWNRGLTEIQMRSLIQGRWAWLAQFGRTVVTTDAEYFVDLTQPGTIRDLYNPLGAWTTGTIPAFSPQTIRFPGW